MADAVTVTLGDMGERARKWVDEGRYTSMSEVLCEGLRALERERADLNAYHKTKVDEALADPRPSVPLDEAFARIRATPFPK